MPDMREEFEAHAKVRWSTDYDGFGDGLFSIQADGRYEYEHIQWDWETWKASRAALRVEDEIDRLKAENDALREALSQISNASCSDARSVVIARTVLTKGTTK
ncbi:hypothetical protein [Pseudomonas aeruginosa]|uniref:hypothetical protein n=1 Tax=Pseudomonas aeruginosa TaxID=287 RepID=UPI00177B906B|nr:hypothetical protein [Pseudomonas aeruginosa]